jgi:hypothetical protein
MRTQHRLARLLSLFADVNALASLFPAPCFPHQYRMLQEQEEDEQQQLQ